jgi:hypothetical protein
VKLEFLSPLGGLVALAILLPFAALAVVESRARTARRFLELGEPTFRERLPGLVALAAIPCLLAVGLAQPIVRYTGVERVRTDAEAYYFLDVSRSMLARPSSDGGSRFDRAKSIAERVHQRLTNIPSGIGTLTDRVLPNLFPTGDDEVFTATLEESTDIEQPPPRGYDEVGTLFAAFDTLGSGTFYRPNVRRRLAIVLTDGESRPFDAVDLREQLALAPHVTFLIVRIGDSGDRIYIDGKPERAFVADRAGPIRAEQLATATGGRVFGESDTDGVVDAARKALGSGDEIEQGRTLRVVALGSWFVLAALLPLGFLLWRRNIV